LKGEGCLELLRYKSRIPSEEKIQLLPIEVVEATRAKLERFIRDRLEMSPTMAIAGWEFYGIISTTLVGRFGIAPYYNAVLSPGIPTIDGLSTIALCATKRYHEYYKGGPVSAKEAGAALAIIGSIGFKKLPLKKSDLSIRGTLPHPLWLTIIKDFRSDTAALVGLLFTILVVSEIKGSTGRPKRAPNGQRRAISTILTMKEIQRLSYFEQLKAAAVPGAIFGDET
jgi:hypothetical protein